MLCNRRSHRKEKPEHHSYRAAATCRNSRKPLCSNEDPAQPKIRKNNTFLPKKEWNSSGSSRSQHQRKTKLPEKTAATCSWSVWASWCVDHRQTFPLPSAGQLHRCPQLLTPARGSGERMWLSLGPELSHHPTHVMAHPCHAPTSRLLRVTKGRVGGWKFHLI